MRIAGCEVVLSVVFLLFSITPVASAQDIAEIKIRAEKGDAQAQSALGKAYHSGVGVAKDDAEAVRWWEKAAEQGDVEAQINLGIAYNFGTGVPKNYAAAARWYRRAAEQGNGGAQSNLALLYHLGLGVPKDDAEAVRWWLKAAEQGGISAQVNLGTAYHFGTGVPKDDAESVRWYSKAAEKGDATAQLSLGMAYIYGAGIPKDEAEGVKWLRKSAAQGNAGGQFWLGVAYHSGIGVAKEPAEAVVWYRKAAEQGNAAAEYDLGQAYYSGVGIAKDNAEAARWWQKAAEQGNAAAQYNLGLAYHSGAGVQKNDIEAYFWINIAASSLDQVLVRQSRDNIGKSLTGAQLSEVQERCRKWVEAHPNSSTSNPSSVTPESSFISTSKYTNAFFGFSLPLPKNLAFPFREFTPSLKKASSYHFLFGLQSLSTNYFGANVRLTLLTVTAEQSSSASPEEVRRTASGPNEKSVTRVEIGGKEFWKSEFLEKLPEGKMRSVVFATALNGYVLQFDIESFDGKLTDQLQHSVEGIVFFDPGKAREVAGPDSRPHNPAASAAAPFQ